MSLIVETGSIVANANSYGETDGATTKAAALAYALDRGVTIPDASIEQFLILGTDYIEFYNERFIGLPVSATQPLSFPRKCLKYVDGTDFPENELPRTLILALYQCCIEQQNGIVLLPSYEGAQGMITEEKIDVIETRYSPKIQNTGLPSIPSVIALLKPLLAPIPALRNYRI